ncbi:aminoglycoside 6-adenylyltransferase [Paenibacillus senegalimassiliensis]|uniref:aminoglycoside 6-adenylyltransferase n=1 Tax=Paenibacillus senegalimassiliensis TaxID=1737426 RepID=UPI000ADED1A4|nr:aminoglycoside 6-adenylyltransferase [Paenibacillus senegalimassiliensis]
MFEGVIRPPLDEMVSWWVGAQQNYSVSIGKMGKYMKTYLPEAYWQMYEQTYSDSNYEKMWTSVFAACTLFRLLAGEVAKELGYIYNKGEDLQITRYLKHVQHLPRDAKEIY